MTLNVLLVDDEYLVLKGLEIMLSSQQDIDLNIAAAMDALDALDKLATWYPDVIIADINMPEIDGLTLLEQVSQTHPQCSFIILSGYEEQDYLKRALRLHVADYLTKPLDKAYLLRRLSELSQQKEQQLHHLLLQLRLMLFSGEAPEVQTLYSPEWNRLFPHPCFTLCAVSLPASEALEKQNQLRAYFSDLQIFSQNQWSAFLINHPERIRPDEMRLLLSNVFGDTLCGISSFPNHPDSAAQLSVFFQEALCDMLLSLLPADSTCKKETAAQIHCRTLLPAIRILTFENTIAEYLKPGLPFLLVFTETLAAYILIAGIRLSPELILQMYNTHANNVQDRRGLTVFLEKTLNFWYDSFSPIEHDRYSGKIKQVCQFMEQNFARDISLEDAADSVSINPSYLSYIFKKETGNTFLQHLTNLRLQKSCELILAQPNLSLDEVASQCGYHSASYFHKLFRGKFGVSPRQWLQREKNHL